MAEVVKDILRVISEGLQIPAIVILIFFIALSVVMLGSIIAEFFTDHRKLSTSIPVLIDQLQDRSSGEMVRIIEDAGILNRQKEALVYLIRHIS